MLRSVTGLNGCKTICRITPHALIPIILLQLIVVKIANASDDIILAVHPYLSPEVLEKKFYPLANYLSRHLKKKVTVRVGSSYEEHIQYIGQNKVDIAYMGAASYVSMIEKFGQKPLLTRLEINGRLWFQGNIITHANSGITTLNDLQGKRVAFGNPNSTMGYIVPHYMMHKANVFTDSSSKHTFLYSHDNVALGVLSGDFDAGAVKPAIFKKYEPQGLVTIKKTPKFSEHLFVTRSNFSVKQIKKLREVMLAMNKSKDGVAALKAITKNVTGLAEVHDYDYENLRKLILEAREIH